MPVEVVLPKVDMDMTHGTVAVWHVAEGETVAKGAALFDIETDKAAMEVEAPAGGRLGAITARPGDRVAVGTVVALIYAEGEEMASPAHPDAPRPAPAHPAPARTESAPPVMTPPVTAPDRALSHDRAPSHGPAPAAGRPAPAAAGSVVAAPSAASAPSAPSAPSAAPAPAQGAPADQLRATPAARAAARAHGLALDTVTGTGPRGRIQRDDVIAPAASPHPPGAPGHWTPEPGPLHVTRRRGNGVPLVLLHGLTADSLGWAPLERALGPDRALIRIDLPAHGRSPRRRVTTFADLARMLTEAFDEATRGLEQAHLVGHSLGGALALAVADVRPRRVASLTLIAPAGLGPEVDAAALAGITRASRVESLAPWLRRLTATPAGISDDYARAAMKLRGDPALRAAQADMAEALFPDGVQAFDLRPALSRVQAPACMLWGRQDHILPHRHALAAGGEVAIHLLAEAGHIPQVECPDRVARIVARHLAGAEAPV